MIKIIVLGVRLMTQTHVNIQEYEVAGINYENHKPVSYVTTDPRFYKSRRNTCVLVYALPQGRIAYSRKCYAY